jgi:hypothetical protein
MFRFCVKKQRCAMNILSNFWSDNNFYTFETSYVKSGRLYTLNITTCWIISIFCNLITTMTTERNFGLYPTHLTYTEPVFK